MFADNLYNKIREELGLGDSTDPATAYLTYKQIHRDNHHSDTESSSSETTVSGDSGSYSSSSSSSSR